MTNYNLATCCLCPDAASMRKKNTAGPGTSIAPLFVFLLRTNPTPTLLGKAF
jgi:hypothetical protein